MRITRTMALAIIALALAGAGLPAMPGSAAAEEPAKAEIQANSLAGLIQGVSKKARTISIKAGDSTEMLKFTEDTTGMEFAEKGETAIVVFEIRDGEKVATEVKQKLAKLPEGVNEIQPDEVAALLSSQAGLTLVDSRPAKRFAEASIAGAVSIPVDLLKEKGESLLPPDKDRQLIFFCGGPT